MARLRSLRLFFQASLQKNAVIRVNLRVKLLRKKNDEIAQVEKKMYELTQAYLGKSPEIQASVKAIQEWAIQDGQLCEQLKKLQAERRSIAEVINAEVSLDAMILLAYQSA